MTAIDIPDSMLGKPEPVRRPGDFKRNHFGAPIVTRPDDPTKTTIYGRPSGFGGNLENPYNLIKWKERQLLIGVDRLDHFKVPGADDRDALDALAAKCHDAAGSNLAADRGTHIHTLTEHADEGRDWEYLIPAGEALGIPAALQRRVVEQWVEFRRELGIETIVVEGKVVNDDLRLAGTYDRLDRGTKPIDCGDLGTLEPGDAWIGDIKTGSITIDDRTGTPRYWIKYPIQIVAYRDGVPYNVESGQRLAWEDVT